MTYLWDRQANQSSNYAGGQIRLAALQNGWTLRRIRFGWSFQGFTSPATDLHGVTVNPLFVGIATTIGDGTELPPSPLDHPGDVAPPTQRWLYWEVRQPHAVGIDAASDVVSWTDGGSSEVTDVQTQVLATGIPGGQYLNPWFTWAGTFGAWDASGAVQILMWSSLLYSIP